MKFFKKRSKSQPGKTTGKRLYQSTQNDEDLKVKTLNESPLKTQPSKPPNLKLKPNPMDHFEKEVNAASTPLPDNRFKEIDKTPKVPANSMKNQTGFIVLPRYPCKRCDLPCDGEAIRADGFLYHPNCFTCADCNTSLTMVGYFVQQGRLLCGNHIYTTGSADCHRCGKPASGEVMSVEGCCYHAECLICTRCGKTLSAGQEVSVKPEGLFCTTCPPPCPEIFDLCGGCFLDLSFTDEAVITACDKRWHPKCFKCSVCSNVLFSEYYTRDNKVFCQKDYYTKYGEKCSTCNKYIIGRVIEVGKGKYHPECACCYICGSQFTDGIDMLTAGTLIWHTHCDSKREASYLDDSPHKFYKYGSDKQTIVTLEYNICNDSEDSFKLNSSSSKLSSSYRNDDLYKNSGIPRSKSFSNSFGSVPKMFEIKDPASKLGSYLNPKRDDGLTDAYLVRFPSLRSQLPNKDELVEKENVIAKQKSMQYSIEIFENGKIADETDSSKEVNIKHRRNILRKSFKSEPTITESEYEETDGECVDSTITTSKSSEALDYGKARLRPPMSGVGDVPDDPISAARSPSAKHDSYSKRNYNKIFGASPSRVLGYYSPWEYDDKDQIAIPSPKKSSLRRSKSPPSPHEDSGVEGCFSDSEVKRSKSTNKLLRNGYVSDMDNDTYHKTRSLNFHDKLTNQGFIKYLSNLKVHSEENSPDTTLKNEVQFIPISSIKYPKERLITSRGKAPRDCDRLHLEIHLTDDDFYEVFTMSRQKFYTLPVWKQNTLKKLHLLF